MTLRARVEEHLGSAVLHEHLISPESWTRLAHLERLLVEWSGAVGLVGFKSEDERDLRYFAESLAALEYLPESAVALDIGSGGGAPALPLAIARPKVEWTLVESNGRKATFLETAAQELGLSNVRVENSRFEGFVAQRPFDVVTVRGVAVSPRLRSQLLGLLGEAGRWLWFSSKERLEAARAEIDPKPLPALELVRGGGYLLRVER